MNLFQTLSTGCFLMSIYLAHDHGGPERRLFNLLWMASVGGILGILLNLVSTHLNGPRQIFFREAAFPFTLASIGAIIGYFGIFFSEYPVEKEHAVILINLILAYFVILFR
jgi:hypothetical protein